MIGSKRSNKKGMYRNIKHFFLFKWLSSRIDNVNSILGICIFCMYHIFNTLSLIHMETQKVKEKLKIISIFSKLNIPYLKVAYMGIY